jgi:hypothetical protein
MAAAALACLALLVSGADALEARLPGGLPLGNAVSAAALVLAAWAALRLAAKGSRLRGIALCALVLSALWLPASILLAGNLELNFAGRAGRAWTVLTAIATLAAFGSLAAAAASRWKARSP